MPRFKVSYYRKVVEYDYFDEVIEAETPEAADAIAEANASSFNMNCPDDIRTETAEAEAWEVDVIDEVPND